MLKCTNCKQVKEPEAFHKVNSKTRGRAFVCRVCRKLKNQQKKEAIGLDEWRIISRGYWLKSQYGITLEDFSKLLIAQNHKCAICKCDEIEVFKGMLFVDHCHRTNKIRGLLCHHCNTGVGKLKESIGILTSAIEYLKEHNG